MAIPSNVMGSGQSALATSAICGTGRTGLVATGANQAGALQLSNTYNAITTSSASTGVKLPKSEMGSTIYIYNGAGTTITVYPFETSGTTINGSASTTVTNGKLLILVAITDTFWAASLGA